MKEKMTPAVKKALGIETPTRKLKADNWAKMALHHRGGIVEALDRCEDILKRVKKTSTQEMKRCVSREVRNLRATLHKNLSDAPK